MPALAQIGRAVARLPTAAALVARHGRPGVVMYFGESPGDDLLATAVARQWRSVRGTPLWYMTRYPEVFVNNPDVALTLDYSPPLAGALSIAAAAGRVRLKYHDYDPREDRSPAPNEHIINLMCASAGLPPLEHPSPVLALTANELSAARLARPYMAVQSSVLSARMPIRNKEWFPDRMESVARHFADRMEVLQLGSPADPPLAGAIDLRGKTTIRQAAATLAGASVFVGMVGLLMHLARATGTRSVILYGGREHPTQSGYPENVNLFSAMHCSPCWLWNQCPYDRECMRRISAADVCAAVERVLTS